MENIYLIENIMDIFCFSAFLLTLSILNIIQSTFLKLPLESKFLIGTNQCYRCVCMEKIDYKSINMHFQL